MQEADNALFYISSCVEGRSPESLLRLGAWVVELSVVNGDR